MKHAKAVVCASIALFMFVGYCAAANTTIDGTNKWAWSAGAGWLNCRPTETNGAVIGQFICTGYFYSESSGWIHLGDGNPTGNVYYSNANSQDYGVNHDGQGNLFGYAWCESTGWINFEWTNIGNIDAPKIDLTTGNLSGYAWGDALGWISLTNYSAWVQTKISYEGESSEATNDFIPDAWEMEVMGSTNLDLLKGGTNDYDGDGISDYNEYLAGTSPTNSSSYFYTTEIVVTNSTNLSLTWMSADSRTYKVEKNADLVDSGGWADSGLGTFGPQAGGKTTVVLPIVNTQLFYRIKAVLPLSE